MFFFGVMLTSVTALAYPVFVVCDRRLARKRLRPIALTDSRVDVAAHTRPRQFALVMRRHSEAITFQTSSQCLDDMARRLRLGHSPTAAFVDAVGTRTELRRMCGDAPTRAQRAGDVGSAVEGLMSHSNPVVHRFATAVWIAQSGHGMSIAALDRAARSHRDRFAIQEEKHAATASSRYSALILTLLPLASFLFSPLWGTNVFSAFAASPMVAVAIVAGIGLNAAGFVWARRIGDGLE